MIAVRGCFVTSRSVFHTTLTMALLAAAGGWTACSRTPAGPTAEDAKKFIDQANDTLLKLGTISGQAGWVQQTYITDDTEAINAHETKIVTDAAVALAKDAVKFDKVEVPADVRRQLQLLKVGLVMPTPADTKEGEELTTIAARMAEYPSKAYTCIYIIIITEMWAVSRF